MHTRKKKLHLVTKDLFLKISTKLKEQTSLQNVCFTRKLSLPHWLYFHSRVFFSALNYGPFLLLLLLRTHHIYIVLSNKLSQLLKKKLYMLNSLVQFNAMPCPKKNLMTRHL